MPEEVYQTELQRLRDDWGSVSVVPELPGVVRAVRDPSTGLLMGMRAPLIAEIINRALDGKYDKR